MDGLVEVSLAILAVSANKQTYTPDILNLISSLVIILILGFSSDSSKIDIGSSLNFQNLLSLPTKMRDSQLFSMIPK